MGQSMNAEDVDMESFVTVMDNPDVLEQIFGYLDPASVVAASLVSR